MVPSKNSDNFTFAEALTKIGCLLKEQREAQSLSVQEISGRTKIRQCLLQAIEEGDLKQLPEPVYVLQFVKRYAEALGLRGEEFSTALPVLENPQYSPMEYQGGSAASFRFIHLYFLYAALLIAAFGGLLYLNPRSAQLKHPPRAVGAK